MTDNALTPSFIGLLIVPRAKHSHKGDYGHVLALAGSRGMTGAAVLCAEAALRSGAGLVTLAMPERELPLAACRLRPEIMTLPLPEGKHGSPDRRSLPLIIDYVRRRKISALAAGPGLGNNGDVKALVTALLRTVEVPVVLDADGLNVLAQPSGRRDYTAVALQRARAKVIVTPHPGEFARLTGVPLTQVQADRGDNAARFARENNVVCVLKGCRTVVSDGRDRYVNTTGNPGMATGGSGDVLTGMIAAFVAQVKEPSLLNAAAVAVCLHGLAGDIAASSLTEIGLAAGDIIAFLPQALNKLRSRTRLR